MKVIVYLLGFSHIAACTYLILYTKTTVDALKLKFNSCRYNQALSFT